jgi:hypothetical protein
MFTKAETEKHGLILSVLITENNEKRLSEKKRVQNK